MVTAPAVVEWLARHFRRARSLRRAFIVGGVGRGLQLVGMWTLVELAGINYVLANILSVALLFTAGYIASKYWTFGRDTYRGNDS